MSKTNKEIWKYYLRNNHTSIRKIHIGTHLDTDDEFMKDMFYNDVEVLFFYTPGERPTIYSPGEKEHAELAAVYQPDKHRYFVRKDLDPRLISWIEEELVRGYYAL